MNIVFSHDSLARIALRVVVLCLALLACGTRPQTEPAAKSSFRIVFGAADRDPADWSGSLDVTRGRVLALTPWHFEKSDKLLAEGYSWQCSSRAGSAPKGIYLSVESSDTVTVRTRQGKFSFQPADISFGEPKGVLQGRALVERIPIATSLTAGSGNENDAPSIAIDRDSNAWLVWLRTRDAVEELVTAPGSGQKPRILGTGEFFRPRLVAAPAGTLHVAVSFRDGGMWKIAVASGGPANWSSLETISAGGPDLSPVPAFDTRGRLWVVWQAWREGRFQIVGRIRENGRWQPEMVISGNTRNAWNPALAPGPEGAMHIAWDAYDAGNYDIFYRRHDGRNFFAVRAITVSPRLEAHASIATDRAGRVWIAWDEAAVNWGRDWAAPIHGDREVRVIVMPDSGALTPPPMGRWLAARSRETLEQPQLLADSNGNIWCLMRRGSQAGGFDYVIYRYTGNPSQAIAVPFSDGRNDIRASVAAAPSGRLALAWSGDGRTASSEFSQYDIYTADIPGTPYTEPTLQPWFGDKTPASATRPKESRELDRTPLAAQGKTWTLLRGQFRRHSQPGWGASLEDHYRYALDAAALDFAAITGPEDAAGRAYIQRLEHKYADLFLLPGRFTPLFAAGCGSRCAPAPRTLLWASRPAGNQAGDLAILDAGVAAGAWKDIALAPFSMLQPVAGQRSSELVSAWLKGARAGVAGDPTPASAAGAGTFVYAESNDRAALVAALRARQTYAATANILLHLTASGHLPGQTVRLTQKPQFVIRAESSAPFIELELYRGNRTILNRKLNAATANLEFTPTEPSANEAPFYLRLTQKDGAVAWSSPLWITHP